MLPIRLRGARTHNLRGVDLELAPGSFVALAGPSGSGKSSLALDTLYAEGQRRFVESFSPYARQFLERLERPDVDELDPVAATVAVDRRAPVKSSRSTLATLADLEPYLAALFAQEGWPTCPTCGVPAVRASAGEAAARVARELEGARVLVTYPLGDDAKDAERYLALREDLAKDGYRRLVLRAPGGAPRVVDLDDAKPSEVAEGGAHVVVDRVRLAEGDAGARRLQEALEAALARGAGRARVDEAEGPRGVPVEVGLVCPSCARRFATKGPSLFSYNSPLGACPACKGFGRVIAVDWDKVVPDGRKTLAKGAIRPWSGASSEWERKTLATFAKRKKIPLDVPWDALTPAQRDAVLEGEGGWEGGTYPGVRAWFRWLEGRTYKMHVRVLLARYREYALCTTCDGKRLSPEALVYRVGGLDLGAWHALTVTQAVARLAGTPPTTPQGARVHDELGRRLGYLDAVGLGYLGLDRQARTLSGGESQRASLTTALGSSLTGALFVLDEPTVGLHALDVPRLVRATRELVDAGNTVLVVEHDATVLGAVDRVVELGPGAGPDGGRIVADGAPGRGRARSAGRAPARAPRAPRQLRGTLVVEGLRAHNVDVPRLELPLGLLVALTGPSGSGKSTVAEDLVYRAVARATGDGDVPRPVAPVTLRGEKALRRAVLVDQSPLGRTARGNAATYTKAWDRIRARFADEPSARQRGFEAAHFSFNVAGKGRCEACAGEGHETVEMQFLADVRLVCPVCGGRRFKDEILDVRCEGASIADVLAMTVDEALARFDPKDEGTPKAGARRDWVLARALDPLVAVGLGYLPLGQPLSTLSGGEAQRLKLARALSEPADGALFVVDEPSAGLSSRDLGFVLRALDALVERGGSVLMVEHDLDAIRAADHVVDLGPGGGPDGGRLVAEGPPDVVARAATRTGSALRGEIDAAPAPKRRAPAAAEAAIRVEHAREHNLKDVSCSIPHGSLAVVTGPSGSGKSSLAFDVVFAEGQRRFMETLTPYARQFLPTLPRPDVDRVVGVPPSIALEQQKTRGGLTSTVATVTEIAHYLRLLYAKVGTPFCPTCALPVAAATEDAILAQARGLGRAVTVYAPAVRARKGLHLDVFTQAARLGLREARVDGARVPVDPPPRLAKAREHDVDLVVHEGPSATLDLATLRRALELGGGSVRLATPRAEERLLSTSRACPRCGTGVPELDPRFFSFATKQGQCPRCEGAGVEGGLEALGDPARRPRACRACDGERLAPLPRQVELDGERYPTFVARSVGAALARARGLAFGGDAAERVARAPLDELVRRLAFVDEVGLGYLALDRAAATLSGGELQRLRLAAQLGAGLTGALYVLDEPTIGLHPRDTGRLVRNLQRLVETGSTVLVVEHDADVIRAASHVVDMGEGGGRNGGHVVSAGPAARVLADPASPTARALEAPLGVERPARGPAERAIVLEGASAHNLRRVRFEVPVGRLTAVCGVSGSGKSTLVQKVFYPALRKHLGLVADPPGPHSALRVPRDVRRALAVDQAPIGRTPRSVPATFLGVWDEARKLFARLPEAQARGFGPGRFSFNAASGGRCPACEGQGVLVSEMSFLPDVVSTCEACRGARFEPATLEVRSRGASAGDVLAMSADEAAAHFAAFPKIAAPLHTLAALGLGYLQIGQASNTLSGGEAQRLKLAAELTAGAAHEPTVYVLDEPTTGLHRSDVRRLVGVLDRLVARGDTVVVVEHHPDVLASADHLVELGPEAGDGGGRVVFEGPVDALLRADTATGRALVAEAGHGPASRRPAARRPRAKR